MSEQALSMTSCRTVGRLEAFVDAKAGLAHPGQTVTERVNLSPQPVGFLEARIPPGEGLEFLCDTLMHGSITSTSARRFRPRTPLGFGETSQMSQDRWQD